LGPPALTKRVEAEFLKQTLEFRLRLVVKTERARLSAALAALEENLDRIWNDPSVSLTARREVLFEVWDECGANSMLPIKHADGFVQPIEAVRRRAAIEGRRRILKFIHTHAVGAAAYTQDELRRFNARRHSLELFAP